MANGELTGVAQDLSFAARSLRRRPAFALTMILTLAVGIGATTSMFSVVDGVLLQPLPYREPGRLVSIYTTFPQWRGQPILGDLWGTLRTPYPDYVRLMNGQRSFADIGGFIVQDGSLRTGDETAVVDVGSSTANLLPLLGASTQAGRWFLPGEDGPSAPRIAVLSYELWQTRFGGARVIDSIISLDEDLFRIVGVLPRRFSLPGAQVASKGFARADVWIPFGVSPSMLQPGNHTLELIGRLRRGVTTTSALADVEPLLRGTRPAARWGTRIVPRADAETADVRRPLLILLAAVGLLLLITCGNVAMLFLSECVVREPELRTRAALGASRGRLARLLLTESALIAAIGAIGGVVLAWWGTRVMLALAPSELPHASMVDLDLRVCLFTVVVAAVVALVAGMLPALTLTRVGAATGLAGNRVAAGRSRLQTTVTAIQAALSIVLMTSAGLLGRSLLNQRQTDPGFRVDHLLSMRVDLPRALDRRGEDRLRSYAAIAERLASVAGVLQVTAMSTPPLAGRTNSQAVTPRVEEKLSNSSGSAERAVILSNYFDVMRIPLRAGRGFTAADVAGAPIVSVISEGMARRFWPGEPAVGKQFRSPQGVLTVVGVVADVKNTALDRAPESLYYLPAAQNGARMSFLMTTRGDPASVVLGARQAIWSVAPGSTISEVAAATELVARALAPGRYRALLSGIFAGMALLLTAVGVTGLIARGVATRLRELCIRMAVGATPRGVFALAVRRGLGAVASGMVVGLLVTPITSRWLADYMYQVRAGDVGIVVATISLTLVVCFAATAFATRRLRGVDLAAVLRE